MRGAAPGQRAGTVLGIDNVAVELPVARVGSRVLAALVDYLVLAALFAVWIVGGAVMSAMMDLGSGWAIALVILGLFLIEHGYFALQEIVLHGQTLGKRVFSLRVVLADGSVAPAGALLVRNLVRLIDIVFGVLLMGTDRLARRLGDRLAGTLVIHQRADDRELVLGRLPEGWGARETRLVEAYLRRAAELEAERREAIGRQLVALVDERAPGFLPELETGTPAKRLGAGFEAELQ